MNKRTIATELSFRGVGIHTGKAVDLVLRPSDSGGIVFLRRGVEGPGLVLDPRAAGARNCSYLESDRGRIGTVEHLLAALAAFEVDSLEIETDGPEIPILDGSARPFAEAIAAAGTRPSGPGGRIMKVTAPFRVEEGGASLEAVPDAGFRDLLSHRLRPSGRRDPIGRIPRDAGSPSAPRSPRPGPSDS